MRLQVSPAIDEAAERALQKALAEVSSAAPVSAWRRAALSEAVEGAAEEERYAFSPRRTRGATRA